MASSSPSPQLMKNKEESRNWAELPAEITSSILLRLSPVEILMIAQKVCRSWRRVCKEPSMWRKIDMGNNGISGYDGDKLCRHVVDLSQGGLVEINMEHFATDSLLAYIAERSSNLRRLKLAMCYPLTSEGFVNAVMNLPLLEHLEFSLCYPEIDVKAIGKSCPLLKTLKLNRPSFSSFIVCDDDALAIAETMPDLRHLELLGNRLTNSGLNAILDNCHHLEHLDLSCCSNINFDGDLEKRCSDRIRDLIRSDDPVADSVVDATFSDYDSDSDSDSVEDYVIMYINSN